MGVEARSMRNCSVALLNPRLPAWTRYIAAEVVLDKSLCSFYVLCRVVSYD